MNKIIIAQVVERKVIPSTMASAAWCVRMSLRISVPRSFVVVIIATGKVQENRDSEALRHAGKTENQIRDICLKA